MGCKKCSGQDTIKYGIVRNIQRYKCKKCGYNFTNTPPRGVNEKIKLGALHLYLEGLGFRSIARFFKVSNVAVLKWIRAFGANIDVEKPASVEFMELDEMHHYISKKKSESAGYGWLLIEIPGESLDSKSVVAVLKRRENSGMKSKI
jgi:transposase